VTELRPLISDTAVSRWAAAVITIVVTTALGYAVVGLSSMAERIGKNEAVLGDLQSVVETHDVRLDELNRRVDDANRRIDNLLDERRRGE
jgi:hypothetical protein